MEKSLRQLAKELGVSHSYLSQVRHGKRPASSKVVSKMVSILPGLKESKDFVPGGVLSYNIDGYTGELCSGSTKDFESFYPGSNPGSPASLKNIPNFSLRKEH